MSEPTFICTRCHGEAPMSELSELPPFFFAAAGSIDACRFDAAVSENVRKPHNVLELGVVRPGEQVAQIVGKNLLREHLRRLRQLLSIFQMFERSRGLPVRVTNTLPLVMPRASQ